ncbi:MAG TPA: DUF2608 domain-containing protein [Lacipirellulaceae bacterium]|nr:DUF2608 domain-containing protein [Lacipirellulaceae bacterium]
MSKSLLSVAQRAVVASLALAALVLNADSGLLASDLLATTDFAGVAATVQRYAEQYGPKHVLLVLDIDNTIMSMDSDLGSDHWFEWQDYLLKNEPNSPHLVARTFPGLLEAQGILFDRGHMHPTEAGEPPLIAKLQKLGIATVLLTSRGPEYRADTERELKRCGYDFARSALPVHDVPKGEYLPYDPAKPEKSGLSPAEVAKYKLGPPRPVLYTHGVFMTAGQHKGIMLLTLLDKADRDIKAIVYVDDNVRHVGSVFSAAVQRNIEITSYQYQHDDVRVQRFEYGDKTAVDQAWQTVKQSLHEVTAAKPQLSEAQLNGVRVPSRTWRPAKRRFQRPCCGCR